MSCLPTLPDSGNVIFSPESESGPMPCVVPDGRMNAPSGRGPAPASLSARQAKEKGLLTSGTYGPRSIISSASAGLSQSLVSRLRAVTALHGSTLYHLTWKERATPAGRSIPALRASVRRISDSGFTGLADTEGSGSRAGLCDYESGKERRSVIADGGAAHGVGNAVSAGLEGHAGHGDGKAGWQDEAGSVAEAGNSGGMENTSGHGRQARGEHNSGDDRGQSGAAGEIYRPGPTDGFWRNADWLLCRDGKWRPVEPGSSPLAHGAANRVGRLRGYGNAIVAPQAEAFIRAVMDIL